MQPEHAEHRRPVEYFVRVRVADDSADSYPLLMTEVIQTPVAATAVSRELTHRERADEIFCFTRSAH